MALAADVARLNSGLVELKGRLNAAMAASNTTLTSINGVPFVAALVFGHTRGIGRFASRDHFASYNATAPSQDRRVQEIEEIRR